MKLGPVFRLKKEHKRILATILDSHHRGAIKRMFISATLHSQAPSSNKTVKDDQE